MPKTLARAEELLAERNGARAARGVEPYWQTTDGSTARLFLGSVLAPDYRLRALPDKSIQTVITSPPYWGLRDYGTGTWEGGSADCDHVKEVRIDRGQRADRDHGGRVFSYKDVCGKCGATRTDQQLGSEPSPDCGTKGRAQCGECFVCVMVAVFREVRRVLRDDGTLWLNLGDSYASGGRVGHGTRVGHKQQTNRGMNGQNDPARVDCGLPDGNLVGVPWRVALALQADGWVLRQDIIWAKPSPMPESVRNRCTKAHEYVFLLTKRADYFCDMEAVKEKGEGRTDRGKSTRGRLDDRENNGGWTGEDGEVGRNKRSVWTVSSQGYPGAHFATFPPKLVEPCVLAGTSARGACVRCGAPCRRVVTTEKLTLPWF